MQQIEHIVYFRCDGNSSIGLGHVFRCLALADFLKSNFSCSFIVHEGSREASNLIAERGYSVHRFLKEDELFKSSFIATLKPRSIVVLDGYQFEKQIQKEIKSAGFRVVCIDDFAEGFFDADLVINQAGGLRAEDFETSEGTRLALGPRYALLNKAFLKKGPSSTRPLSEVFVCFGGSDPQNLSKLYVEKLLQADSSLKINLVLGAANIHKQRVKDEFRNLQNLNLFEDLSPAEMADKMKTSDLAVVSASGISYEAASLNVPIYCVQYAENQSNLFHYLTSEGLAVGQSDIESPFEIPSSETLKKIKEKQAVIFDGNSPRRLLGLFIALEMVSRHAKEDDALQYFDWANDPDVRANSLTNGQIVWEEHIRWFQNRMNHSTTLMYLFEFEHSGVGQVRIELNESDEAIINYSVSKNFRGMGLGEEILRAALGRIRIERPEIVRIRGVVKYDNLASIRVFRNLHFDEIMNNEIFEFSKELS